MNILAGVIGAAVGLLGVIVGTWINHHREDRRWIREKKLAAASEFIAAAGQLYNYRRGTHQHHEVSAETRANWVDQLQRGRSVLHLLCEDSTIERANRLAERVWHAPPAEADEEHRDETVDALRELTSHIRREIARSGR